VLILSALGQVDDRVKGLRAGATYYLPKPYSFAELLARVEVLARSARRERGGDLLPVGDLRARPALHSVKRGATEIDLSAREFRLLEYLMKHAGRCDAHDAARKRGDYHFDPQTT